MNSKSSLIWFNTKEWCRAHPGQVAAIVTPQGTFRVTFEPPSTEPLGVGFSSIDPQWQHEHWCGALLEERAK